MNALIYLFPLSLLSIFGHKEKSYTVSGTITFSSAYCGGTEPTDEQLWRLAQTRPYANKRFYLKHGTVNTLEKPVIDTINSDAEGRFELQLSAGEYCILQDQQLDRWILDWYDSNQRNIIFTTDTNCLENWWDQCIVQFTVTDSNVTLSNIHVSRPCFLPEGVPCLIYNGPIPN